MSDTNDPFLNALLFFGKVHSRSINPHGAVQGLPLTDGRLTPDLFPRAAANCGFEAKLVKRSLKDLHGAVLPVVLVLENNDAVMLVKVGGSRKKKTAQVIILSSGNGVEEIDMDMLNDAYSGYALLVKPEYEFEKRSDFNSKTTGKHWFWGTLWKFRSFYARVGLATLMINLLALASSIFMMTVYDRVVPNKAEDTLFVLAIGVGVAFVFEFLLKMLRGYFVDRAGHRIDMKLGSELYARMLGMRFNDRPNSAGSLASQARSYDSLREFFTSATLAAIVDLPFVYLFVAVIFLLGGPMVALPLIIGIFLILAIGILMQIPISRAVNNVYNASNQRQALVVEGIQALETIKTTRSESELQAKMEDSVRISAKSDGVARGFSQFAMNSTGFINQAVQVFMIIMAFYQVIQGEMQMGAMIACVMLTARAMAPMAMVASLMARLQQSRRALKGLDQIMKMDVERDKNSTQYLSIDSFVPEVRALDAKFSYHPESEPVVKDVSFVIEPGEKVAILGRIGSGKSTLLRMLMGLYQASEGRIEVSGLDLRQMDPMDLRMNTGYVPQNPTLLYGSIRSNLKAGCPWIRDTEMIKAIDRSGLTEFVRSLPQGVDYEISEGGGTLSGGQRQALAVARAIIEEPDLLIMDEPTSAMDSTSEKRLLHCMRDYLNEKEERTAIIATHKRSVLALVDRIIVMDNGKIIADGPRNEVLKSNIQPELQPKAAEARSIPTRATQPNETILPR